MDRLGVSWILGVALALPAIDAATAQVAAPSAPAVQREAAAPPAEKSNLDVLKGAWVRPDGGYMIAIRNIGPNGQLDALYFNPNQLPFARAQASGEGGKLGLFLELQAGGYAGSTYTLAYDPVSDQLRGIYYQAVARQKFEVVFARRR